MDDETVLCVVRGRRRTFPNLEPPDRPSPNHCEVGVRYPAYCVPKTPKDLGTSPIHKNQIWTSTSMVTLVIPSACLTRHWETCFYGGVCSSLLSAKIRKFLNPDKKQLSHITRRSLSLSLPMGCLSVVRPVAPTGWKRKRARRSAAVVSDTGPLRHLLGLRHLHDLQAGHVAQPRAHVLVDDVVYHRRAGPHPRLEGGGGQHSQRDVAPWRLHGHQGVRVGQIRMSSIGWQGACAAVRLVVQLPMQQEQSPCPPVVRPGRVSWPGSPHSSTAFSSNGARLFCHACGRFLSAPVHLMGIEMLLGHIAAMLSRDIAARRALAQQG